MKDRRRYYPTGTTIAGFIVLFVALGSLVTGIVLAARRTNAVLFEHELERAANGLVEDFATNNRLEYEYIRESIVGFGIMRWDGTAIVSYGNVLGAEEVPAEISRGPVYVYDKKDDVVTLYRPIGMAMAPGHGRMMQQRPPLLDLGNLLYLRFNAGDYFRQQNLYTAAAVVGPLLVGILTGLLFYLSIRNLQYRREIVEREKLSQLGESARTLMHEIKNPLNAINIRASIIAQTDSGEIGQDALAIREEVERLKTLTDKINTFLKDPVGERRQIDVIPCIREVLEANRWDDVAIITDARGQEAPIQIQFDRERFRSVIENTVSNACESGDGEGAGDGRIEISVELKKKAVIVRVMDRGAGLPDTDGERLFDPFFTTKTRGSGIGLAVSRRFMRAGGGDIELRRRQGGGTEAALTFPRVFPS
ncbi:MAG: HAMP domain-containing histidine kinase [Spirochaetales bacterium]|nr:HAMP domain-containing histidine kinase [Spirochaetales bacterium]